MYFIGESGDTIPEGGNDYKMIDEIRVKEEMEDDMDMEDDIPKLGPAALGLQRVGTPAPPKPAKSPLPVLNARGMPVRIRKKNRYNPKRLKYQCFQ